MEKKIIQEGNTFYQVFETLEQKSITYPAKYLKDGEWVEFTHREYQTIPLVADIDFYKSKKVKRFNSFQYLTFQYNYQVYEIYCDEQYSSYGSGDANLIEDVLKEFFGSRDHYRGKVVGLGHRPYFPKFSDKVTELIFYYGNGISHVVTKEHDLDDIIENFNYKKYIEQGNQYDRKLVDINVRIIRDIFDEKYNRGVTKYVTNKFGKAKFNKIKEMLYEEVENIQEKV